MAAFFFCSWHFGRFAAGNASDVDDALAVGGGSASNVRFDCLVATMMDWQKQKMEISP